MYYLFNIVKSYRTGNSNAPFKKLTVLCQIVLVTIIKYNELDSKGDENHPFIMPLIKKILAVK